MDFGLILSWVWDGFSGFEWVLCLLILCSEFGFVDSVFGFVNSVLGFWVC